VPYEHSIAALRELQEEGKIRHIGVSNVSVEQLETAREIVEVVSVQNRFNLTDRHSQDVLERCEELGIAFFPWAPIAAGELAEPGGPVDRIESRHDASPAQVALAWLLARSAAMVPIPGTSSVEHLEENLGAARLELTAAELAELEAAAD
jgi:pyridoxine 4-dehydrogenase